uniref:DUF4939 domain-containing protein n=1 Tax=Podarcis muralis TaxID=64176 RepID=A0A670I8J6_PODMU
MEDPLPAGAPLSAPSEVASGSGNPPAFPELQRLRVREASHQRIGATLCLRADKSQPAPLPTMADQAAVLVALAQENQVLTHTIQQLSNAAIALQQCLEALPASGADTPASDKYPVALPEKFNGSQASFPMFLAQTKLYIQGRSRNFPDDRTKVHFLNSLLKDRAAKWALPLLRQNSPLLTDYTGFCNHLEILFGNPQKGSQANRAIRRLKQDKSIVAAYATECRQHSWLPAPVLPSSSTTTAKSLEEPMQLGAVRPCLSPSEKTRRL